MISLVVYADFRTTASLRRSAPLAVPCLLRGGWSNRAAAATCPDAAAPRPVASRDAGFTLCNIMRSPAA